MSTTNNQQDFYCILSMDGATPEGGGYITAGVLQHLWNDLQLGASCRANQNPSEPEKPIAPIPVSFLNPDTTEGTLTVSPKSFRRKMIFAGTSSGAWSALFLAKHKNPDEALAGGIDAPLIRFWRKATDALSPKNSSLPKLLGALAGQTSFSGNEHLMAFFKEVFGSLKLADLHHNVVVTSFQLDNRSPRRRWAPKVFRNFGENPDNSELVVDVALRSAAAPVFLPLYQSSNNHGPCFLDGGVFANNPAMCALAEVCAELQRITAEDVKKQSEARIKTLQQQLEQKEFPPAEVSSVIGSLQRQLASGATDGSNSTAPESVLNQLMRRFGNIRMLSIGNGFSTQFIDPKANGESLDWGYAKWMLDPAAPAVLLNLVWKAGEEAVDRQCSQILAGVYKRLQPYAFRNLDVVDGDKAIEVIESLKNDDYLEKLITETIQWMGEVQWLDNPVPTITKGEITPLRP